MISARHHPYKLWKERRKSTKLQLQLSHTLHYTLNRLSEKDVLPSKSTSPSPFKSTSLRMSSTSFRPTWKNKTKQNRMVAVSKAQHTKNCYFINDNSLFSLWAEPYLLSQQFSHCVSELRRAYGTISISVELKTTSRGSVLKTEK